MNRNQKSVKVILNPYSGRNNGAKQEISIRDALVKAGVAFDMAYTEGKGHAIESARQARLDGYKIIAVAGGDGTINEVVNGLAQVNPTSIGTLAIFPTGSGNDFASMIGCSKDFYSAAKAIAANRTCQVDLGYLKLYNDTSKIQSYFHNNLGIGFEAQVIQESQKINYLRGMLIYLLATFKALVNRSSSKFDLHWKSVTGKDYFLNKETFLLSIGNSKRNGGGFYMNPKAKLDDGLLDMVIFDNVSNRHFLSLLPKIIKGTHIQDLSVSTDQIYNLSLSCFPSLPIQVDGELLPINVTQVEIEVLPSKLEVIV